MLRPVQLADNLSRFEVTNMRIDNVSVVPPLSLRAKARRLKARSKGGSDRDRLPVAHEYPRTRRYKNRQQEITRIRRSVKSLAMERQLPVLLLSQLNRAPATRSNSLTRLIDLDESGSIGQDADVGPFLHREDYSHRGERDYVKTNAADLIVAEQRNGPTVTVPMTALSWRG